MKKIVILGAGFAGIAAAFRIKKRLKDSSVIVIDRNIYHTFTPALAKLASAKIPQEECLIKLKPLLDKKRIHLINSEIRGIDVKNNLIKTKDGKVNYDFLIKTMGSETNFFNIPGAKKNSFVLKTAIDAIDIRNHIEDVFKRIFSSKEPSEADKNIVIIGGGLTGIELATDIVDYVISLCNIYSLSSRDVRVHIVDRGDRIFKSTPKASNIIENTLASKEILIHTGKGIKMLKSDRVIFEDKSYIKSKTIIWAGGIKPNKLIGEKEARLCCANGLISDAYLQSITKAPIFEAGDCVICYDEKLHTHIVHNAPNAVIEGKHAADNIIRSISNRELKEYKPVNQPSIITLGDKNAVFIYRNFVISGRWLALLKTLIRKHYLFKINYVW